MQMAKINFHQNSFLINCCRDPVLFYLYLFANLIAIIFPYRDKNVIRSQKCLIISILCIL